MSRVEAFQWQSHIVTVRLDSLRFTATLVKVTTVTGERLSIPNENFVWLSDEKGTGRICYNRLVVSSGTNKLKRMPDHYGFAVLTQGTSLKLTVNKKFHKLHKDA